MSESKRPKISRWVYEVLQQVGRPITRKAIVIELKHRGREVSHEQLGTALSNMRHRKQLVVTGNKLKKFSVSELPVAPWDRAKKAVVVERHVEPVVNFRVKSNGKEIGRDLEGDVKAKASGQESLMLVYMRVKIAAMVLCTGAVALLSAVLAARLL
tara:strand:+ start:400 stop:867 length:468 start_codon:yes stop_codon:yes gene_type:complete